MINTHLNNIFTIENLKNEVDDNLKTIMKRVADYILPDFVIA